MSKPGRNDPCPCGSGKKYKKCCEKKLFRGKFTAQKIETPKQIQENPLSSIFQSNILSANEMLKQQEHAKPIPSKKEPEKKDKKIKKDHKDAKPNDKNSSESS